MKSLMPGSGWSVALATAVSLAAGAAMATEVAGDTHPNRVEDWSVGELLPAGVYGFLYSNYYDADRLKNQAVDFYVNAWSLTPRLMYVTSPDVLGARWAVQALLRIISSDVRLAGASSHKTGPPDATLSPFLLDWAIDPDWHVIAGGDLVVPVGEYNSRRGANHGKNQWVLRPALASTYRHGQAELSRELGYDFNFRNHGTRERSEQVAHPDFVAGYHLDDRYSALLGWLWLQQTTDDRGAGGVIPQSRFKGRAYALGPHPEG